MPLRPRIAFLWVALVAAAVVAGFALHRLYRTAQAEIDGQAERTTAQARAAAEARIREYLDETRRSLLTELAGFHEDGLASTLRRWDAATPLVSDVFLWERDRGFVLGGAVAPDPAWVEFSTWRTAHPTAIDRSPTRLGQSEVSAQRTLDNAAFPAAALRYQDENLDLLRDRGGQVDPWAGWSVRLGTPPKSWVLWYRPGPDAPVRGGRVDTSQLVIAVRPLLPGGEAARVAIVEQQKFESGTASSSASIGFREPAATPIAGLPGYLLAVEPGDIFTRKAADARFNALTAAGLVGLFLLGVAALGLRTWREARDAGQKINFVTQVSHELRTPLTSIRMFSDLLGEPAVTDEKRRKFAGMISAESARLTALIERLLAFNALEKNRQAITPVALDVIAVVDQVREEMSGPLARGGLHLAVTAPTEPVRALADASILKQALLNLLDNAVKYAGAGGVVDLRVAPEPGRVALQVADRGPGLPAEVRTRLFEPFVQGGGTLTTKASGVGLGLSLSRGLLRRAGGDLVWLPSETGTTFEIRLPAAP